MATFQSRGIQDKIRNELPQFSVTADELILGQTWARNFARLTKHMVCTQISRRLEPWNADDVKTVFMDALHKSLQDSNHRKLVVREYNKAIGSRQFESDWPRTSK